MERSCPVLLPPRPLEGRKARILQNQHRLENTRPPCSPSIPPDPPDVGNAQTHGPMDTTAERNHVKKITHCKQHSASLEDEMFKSSQDKQSSQTCQVVFNNPSYMCDVCWERNCICNLSESDGTKPQTGNSKPAWRVNETENTKLKPSQENNSRNQNYVVENDSFELKCTVPPSADKTDRHVCFERAEKDFEEEEKINQGSCIIPSIHPRSSRGAFGYGEKRSRRDLGSDRLQLQDSFSRTKAHRIFHESLQDATVDLRDNHYTGRKHFFYGLNSYYFHN